MTPELRKPLALLALGLVVVLGVIWLLGRAGDGADGGTASGSGAVDGSEEERLAAVRERLVDLRVAQDTFHRHYGIYGRSVGQMRFAVPSGMNIEIVGYTSEGWAAQASVRGVDRLCAIFVGDSAKWAFPPAARSGEPACISAPDQGPSPPDT
jgi:hypothetical protein